MAGRRPNGDGTIRKREDGRWEGRITIGKRKDGSCIVKTVTAKTQKALLQKTLRKSINYSINPSNMKMPQKGDIV